MPWKESTPMDERLRFVQDAHRPGWTIAELCRRYEVSRKTGYKWLAAYARAGPAALADGSHRPTACPRATAPEVVRLILQLQQRYTWGARKMRRLLAARVPAAEVPTKPTVHRILERHNRRWMTSLRLDWSLATHNPASSATLLTCPKQSIS